MIFKITIALLLLISGFYSHPSDQTLILQDSIIKKDTTKTPQMKQSNSEITLRFNNLKLAPVNVRIIFSDFFKKYIGVKESLVYNDSYGAGSKTIVLLDEMKSKSDEVMKGINDARWEIFIQNYNSIRNKVKDIKFIDDQRFTFSEISRGLQGFIRQYGLHDQTVYLMYYKDPDTNETRYWLSDKRDNKNPYLGTMDDSLNVNVKEVWIYE
ncbi:MAG TPA: DUF3347 domain-containing protein [Ignavibacteria bacterium]|nr:DUF3347 domain-containing protein [Ignavibacteria bacterium]HMR39344.1 DUF3347 domain-containing protein [Ignavibacteria bacterium]